MIDCSRTILSCEVNSARIRHELMSSRPIHMPTMELWERPMLAAIRVEYNGLSVELVPVVNEYQDVFPDELPGLPPVREIEFGIDLEVGTKPISKQAYRMAAVKMDELKNQVDEFE